MEILLYLVVLYLIGFITTLLIVKVANLKGKKWAKHTPLFLLYVWPLYWIVHFIGIGVDWCVNKHEELNDWVNRRY